jgi:hypothetical protein
MNISDLVKTAIHFKHGWAVAEQFEDTFNGESFEEQNYNALRYIQETIDVLLNGDLLSEDAQDDLQLYADELMVYLAGGEGDGEDEEKK